MPVLCYLSCYFWTERPWTTAVNTYGRSSFSTMPFVYTHGGSSVSTYPITESVTPFITPTTNRLNSPTPITTRLTSTHIKSFNEMPSSSLPSDTQTTSNAVPITDMRHDESDWRITDVVPVQEGSSSQGRDESLLGWNTDSVSLHKDVTSSSSQSRVQSTSDDSELDYFNVYLTPGASSLNVLNSFPELKHSQSPQSCTTRQGFPVSSCHCESLNSWTFSTWPLIHQKHQSRPAVRQIPGYSYLIMYPQSRQLSVTFRFWIISTIHILHQ